MEDPHKLKFVIINTLKPKRTKQIKEILDNLNIKLHKLTTEPDDITSFTKKETSQESIFYKMINGKRDSDTFKSWKIPKGLESELSCPVKADGKRKSAPVNRYRVEGDRPIVRAKVTGADFLAANYDTEPDSVCGSQEQIPVIQAVVQAAPVVEPVVLAAPAVEPVVQAAPAVEPVVQAVWIPSPETNLEAEVEKLRAILAERDRLVEAQSKHIADKENQLAEKNTQLIDKAKQMQALASAFCGVGV